jgi:hypothetical protein
MAIVYVLVIRQQGDQPAAWFLGGMGVCALLSSYGAARSAPRRVWALVASSTILIVFGILAILSIGLPILVAGIFAVVAVVRSGDRPDG